MNSSGSLWVLPAMVTCRSSMASSKAACTLAGARLISSASTRLPKIGPWLELEAPLAAFVVIHLGAGDVGGQEVGGELDTAKLGLEVAGEAFDGTRFGQAGQTFEQQVAVRQQCQQQALDDLLLADDRFSHALFQLEDVVAGAHGDGHYVA